MGTDADMDKTIDKAAGEVLEEAKAEPKEKTDSGDEAQKEIIPHMVELETVKKKGVIKEVVESNESKIKDAVEAKPKGSLNNTEDLEGKEKEKVKRQGRTGAECQENKEYQIKNEEGKKVEEQEIGDNGFKLTKEVKRQEKEEMEKALKEKEKEQGGIT